MNWEIILRIPLVCCLIIPLWRVLVVLLSFSTPLSCSWCWGCCGFSLPHWSVDLMAQQSTHIPSWWVMSFFPPQYCYLIQWDRMPKCGKYTASNNISWSCPILRHLWANIDKNRFFHKVYYASECSLTSDEVSAIAEQVHYTVYIM